MNNKSNENLWKALKHASAINPNDIEHGGKESFDFMKELRSYKEQYGLGGDSHDLSKWSRSDRAEYSLDVVILFKVFGFLIKYFIVFHVYMCHNTFVLFYFCIYIYSRLIFVRFDLIFEKRNEEKNFII